MRGQLFAALAHESEIDASRQLRASAFEQTECVKQSVVAIVRDGTCIQYLASLGWRRNEVINQPLIPVWDDVNFGGFDCVPVNAAITFGLGAKSKDQRPCFRQQPIHSTFFIPFR